MSNELTVLDLHERVVVAEAPRRLEGWLMSLLVHLPLVLWLLFLLLFFEVKPEDRRELKPDVEVAFLPEPRPEPRPVLIPPPSVARPQPPPPADLFGWKSHGTDPNAPAMPPGPPLHEQTAGSESQHGAETAPERRTRIAPEQTPTSPRDRPTELTGQGAIAAAPTDAPQPEDVAPHGEPGVQRTEPERPSVPDLPTPSLGRGASTGRGELPDFNVKNSGGFYGSIRFDDGNYRWEDYSTKVYFAIYRAWLRELEARWRNFERDQKTLGLANLDSRCAIHFVIHRSGKVDAIEVVDPAILPALTEASEKALTRATLPPLPEDYPHNETGLTFGFEVHGFGSALQLEYQLRMAKQNGEF